MTSTNHCSEGPRAQVLHWVPHLLEPALLIAFQLYDVLRFYSTVVIYELIIISSQNLNNQIFQNLGA